jgi:hypothetical protein
MAEQFDDGYDSYYADRLWQLLPGVYRAMDSDAVGVDGPLREVTGRIGAQVAVVRRSIDQLWADQSIETCDDWVIPYLGDLLDVNLVDGLDATGRRQDVAKTIHYRRRKGTPAILEEIAQDITGWQARAVEAFRSLGRTRHGLDPRVGGEETLLEHEGLVGTLTSTAAGGFADLRSVHGATLAGSPFDEFAHTADLRAGRGAVGHYGISKLLVFVWRLQVFSVLAGDPVQVSGCPDSVFVFDPTGRCLPLFMEPWRPPGDSFADDWTPAREWQVPGPLTDSLQKALDAGLYPDAASVWQFTRADAGSPLEPVAIKVTPEVGEFSLTSGLAAPLVSYQYAAPGTIGAGTYDRTLLGDPPTHVGTVTPVTGGGGALAAALPAAGVTGTVEIGDSRTYTAPAPIGATATPIRSLLIQAGPGERPVIRMAPVGAEPPTWVFTGGGDQALADAGLPSLTLDGLLFSGGDIVLRGAFARVRVTGFTADPGTAAPGQPGGFADAVDGQALVPTRIWIEADPDAQAGDPGAIAELTIDHSILGPVRTRNGGAVAMVTITDSIIQGLAPAMAPTGAVSAADVYDPVLLGESLASESPLAAALAGVMPAADHTAIAAGGAPVGVLVDALGGVIASGTVLDQLAPFASLPLDPDLSSALASGAVTDGPANRALLAAAFPVALAPAALALADATVALTRVTVLGAAYVHRLSASDSIITEFSVIEDAQDGCMRYSAVCAGSWTPRQYACALLAGHGSLFTSTSFGHPGYGQLLETADSAIVGGTSGVTVTAGAENGSEMGAYSSGLAPIKERGVLIKYGEYMPLGLSPVIVHVT